VAVSSCTVGLMLVYRSLDLAAVEGVLEDLHDALDEPPETVRARLRQLVPEFGGESAGVEPPAPAEKRQHAK